MRKLVLFLALAALTVPLAAQSAGSTDGDKQTVSIALSRPGQPAEIHVSVTRGGIRVEGYDGDEIIVEGRSAGDDEPSTTRDGMRRLNVKSIAFAVEEKDNRVEVTSQSWHRDIQLDLKVPRKASLVLKTVNDGDIEVRGVDGEHELANTNGDVEALDVSGSVTATTTNGDVTVELLRVAPATPMAFSTLNGDIEVTFPASLDATFRMRSSYGDILTDFDVEVTPVPPKVEREATGSRVQVKVENEVRAKVGKGGPEITFTSFHGDVVVKKGS